MRNTSEHDDDPDEWEHPSEACAILKAKEGDFSLIVKLLREGYCSETLGAVAADIIEGKLSRPRHRPTKGPRLLPAVGVRELENKGWPRKAAVVEVARRQRISQRTVQSSLAFYKLLARDEASRLRVAYLLLYDNDRPVLDGEGLSWSSMCT
jgi:hypothetical protein